jgi:hypothetical protein
MKAQDENEKRIAILRVKYGYQNNSIPQLAEIPLEMRFTSDDWRCVLEYAKVLHERLEFQKHRVNELRRELTQGHGSEKRCPQCGSTVLRNLRGDEWCSFVGGNGQKPCTWGLGNEPKIVAA